MSTQPMDWKNPVDVSIWRATRKKSLSDVWRRDFKPLLMGIPLAARATDLQPGEFFADPITVEEMPREGETLSARARRLDHQEDGPGRKKPWSVAQMIGKNSAGEAVISAPARRASEFKKSKAVALIGAGLDKKANREIACGVFGGVVKCLTGHKFHVAYECGNRYCPTCGPNGAKELFASTIGPLQLAAAKMLDCGDPNCKECYWFRRDQTKADLVEGGAVMVLPHWPPPPGEKPKTVVAIFDFTIRNFYKGRTLGTDELEVMRYSFKLFNQAIKRFMRALERKIGMERSDYGLLWCDELGATNSNIHAHGVYVGPWLPVKDGEFKKLWSKITGGAGQILFLKKAESLERALYHALKYPAKYAGEEKTTAERAAHLEIIFHRVRRIHALARFYNMPKPKDDLEKDGLFNKCPLCGERLSEPDFRYLLSDLARQGSRDVTQLHREIGRAKVLEGGAFTGSPISTDNCAPDFLSSGDG